MAGTFEGNARIGRLVVTGVGPWKDNAFAGSVVAASTIGTVNLKSVVADNGGSTFGLVVQTPSGPAAPPAIGKLIIGNPAATWTAVRESPTTPTILGDFGIKVL
jgi:hypothetical protein